MAFQFPWTNFHELNLDWFLSKFKQFTANYLSTTATVEIVPTAEQAEVTVTGGSLDDDTDIVDPFTFNFKLPTTIAGAVNSVNNKVGNVVLTKTDIGLSNVANVRQYSANNPPPYPVTSVNGMTGDVVVPGGSGAVDSVNSKTGTVVLYGTDINMSSGDNTKLKTAIEAKANSTELQNYLPLTGGTLSGVLNIGTVANPISPTVTLQQYVVGGASATASHYKDMLQLVNSDNNRVAVVRAIDNVGFNEFDILVFGENNNPTNSLQLVNTNGVQTARIYGTLTIPSPPAGNNSTLACTTAWAQNEFKYKTGDVVNVGGSVFAGYFDSSKNLYFFIPLNKDMSNVTGASITTDTSWAIYCAGTILLSNATLASFGTVTCTKMETGILIKVVPSNTTSLTARETVSVRATTAKITLT